MDGRRTGPSGAADEVAHLYRASMTASEASAPAAIFPSVESKATVAAEKPAGAQRRRARGCANAATPPARAHSAR
jgi:hypothetical protein